MSTPVVLISDALTASGERRRFAFAQQGSCIVVAMTMQARPSFAS
jgi:hypothetical protein